MGSEPVCCLLHSAKPCWEPSVFCSSYFLSCSCRNETPNVVTQNNFWTMRTLSSSMTWKPVSLRVGWIASLFSSSFWPHLLLLIHPKGVNGSKIIPEYPSQVLSDCECPWWLPASYFPQTEQRCAYGNTGKWGKLCLGLVSLYMGHFLSDGGIAKSLSPSSVSLDHLAAPSSSDKCLLSERREIIECSSDLCCRGWATSCKERPYHKTCWHN